MSEGKRFGDWIYEEGRAQRDSVLAARALFLTSIGRVRPGIIKDLFEDVLPTFYIVIVHMFPKTIEPPPREATIHQVYAPFRRLTGQALEGLFKNWTALQDQAAATQLCTVLNTWATAYNLCSAPWCYDHAIRCLREWVLDGTLPRVYELPLSFDTEISKGWTRVTTRAYSEALTSRCNLQTKVYGDPLYVEKCRTFRAPSKAKSVFFETEGWPFLEIGKDEWERRVNRQFDEVLHHSRSNGGDFVPKGARSVFTKALTQYLQFADSARRRLVSKYALVKAPQHYRSRHNEDDHIDWLIRYQIPPTKKHNEISAGLKSRGISTEIVRKYIRKTAGLIGIKLRDPKEHAGRPAGRKTSGIPSGASTIGHLKSPKRK